MHKGKLLALLSIVTGFIALGLAIYILAACEFYEVDWVKDGIPQSNTPGIYSCKYSGDDSLPTNAMDYIAVIALLIAIVAGAISTLALASFYFKWKFRVKNPGLSSCLYMLSVVCHAVTYTVLIGSACDRGYDGDCNLLTNGYVNLGAMGAWFIAAGFARQIAAAYNSGSSG